MLEELVEVVKKHKTNFLIGSIKCRLGIQKVVGSWGMEQGGEWSRAGNGAGRGISVLEIYWYP